MSKPDRVDQSPVGDAKDRRAEREARECPRARDAAPERAEHERSRERGHHPPDSDPPDIRSGIEICVREQASPAREDARALSGGIRDRGEE